MLMGRVEDEKKEEREKRKEKRRRWKGFGAAGNNSALSHVRVVPSTCQQPPRCVKSGRRYIRLLRNATRQAMVHTVRTVITNQSSRKDIFFRLRAFIDPRH